MRIAAAHVRPGDVVVLLADSGDALQATVGANNYGEGRSWGSGHALLMWPLGGGLDRIARDVDRAHQRVHLNNDRGWRAYDPDELLRVVAREARPRFGARW